MSDEAHHHPIDKAICDWDLASEDIRSQGICGLEFSISMPFFGDHASDEGHLLMALPDGRIWLFDMDGEDRMALNNLCRLLSDPEVKKVLYDGRPLLSWIWNACGKRPRFRNVFDLLVASQISQAGFYDYVFSKSSRRPWTKKTLDHSLEALARRHLEIGLEIGLDKRHGKMAKGGLGEDCRDVADRLAERAAVLLPLYAIFQGQIVQNNLEKVAELEFRTLGPVAEMEVSGIHFDARDGQDMIRMLEEELVGSVLEMQALAREQGFFPVERRGRKKRDFLYPYLDPNQTEDIKSYFRSLGFELLSTRSEVLRDLASQGLIFADRLLTYRRAFHQLTFLNHWVNAVDPDDGRVHPRYPQARSVTGRIGSKDPSAHQVPRRGKGAQEIRRLFRASPERKLVKADFSTIEMRIMAYLSGDRTLTRAFQKGVDVHRLTASRISGAPMEEVTIEQRQAAKGVNFLLIYGGSAETLQRRIYFDYGIAMSLDEALEVHERFFETYPGIRDWHEMQRRAMGYTHQHYFHNCVSGTYALPLTSTFTVLGRRRVWPRFGEGLRASKFQMYNNPCQGTGADLLKMVLCELYDRLESPEARIICSIHDEILMEVPEVEAGSYAKMLEEIMTRVGSKLLHPVPVTAEVEVADSWAG